MFDSIEKLLIVQDRDSRILRTQAELDAVEPERTQLSARLQGGQEAVEASKHKGKQIESRRKELELEVDSLRQRIDKYSIQQFQTKKNEEYRALTHEIEQCKIRISSLEDQELELMEQAEAAQRDVAAANQVLGEFKKTLDAQMADLATKEELLRKQLADWQKDYTQLVSAVRPDLLSRYERLRAHKGDRVVVGVEHSVCGGCHMKLPTHVIVACQAGQALTSCPNCGRILYYARHMDLAVID